MHYSHELELGRRQPETVACGIFVQRCGGPLLKSRLDRRVESSFLILRVPMLCVDCMSVRFVWCNRLYGFYRIVLQTFAPAAFALAMTILLLGWLGIIGMATQPLSCLT